MEKRVEFPLGLCYNVQKSHKIVNIEHYSLTGGIFYAKKEGKSEN